MRIQASFASALLIVLLQACSSPTEPLNVNCPDIGRSALLVYVRESVSDALIGNAVTATAVDGRFFDAVTTPDLPAFAGRPLTLVDNRAGTYDVYVSRAGYKAWVTYDVQVKNGVCGIEPVNVAAKLQRS
jgi:hypothetical protein